ncbi:hypothetical protein M0E78_06655 [Corynebacterium sp. P6145]|uniref:hypothetical protein n=1 Tax=Corynebacterium antarcticum TaxID=2800405 RepID=UPI002003C5D5|nr:hypothetical protein [Corynebacterium antarcticum]MCK7642588.1 hypothetical protein [Corynebacterium antarcticum]
MITWRANARTALRELSDHRWRTFTALLLLALPALGVMIIAGVSVSGTRDPGNEPMSGYRQVWISDRTCLPFQLNSTFDPCLDPDHGHLRGTPYRDRLAAAMGPDADAVVTTVSVPIRVTTGTGTTDSVSATAVPETPPHAPRPGTFLLDSATAAGLGLEPGDVATVGIPVVGGGIRDTELTLAGYSTRGAAVPLADLPGERAFTDPGFHGSGDGESWPVSHYLPETTADRILANHAAELEAQHVIIGTPVETPESGRHVVDDLTATLTDAGAESVEVWIALLTALLMVVSVIAPLLAVGPTAPEHPRRVPLIKGLIVGSLGAVTGVVISAPAQWALLAVLRPGAAMIWPRNLAILTSVVGTCVGAAAALRTARHLERPEPDAPTDNPPARAHRFHWPTAIGPVILLAALITGPANAVADTTTLTVLLAGTGLVLSSPLLLRGAARLAGHVSRPARLAAREALRHPDRGTAATGVVAEMTLLAAALIAGMPPIDDGGTGALPHDVVAFEQYGRVHPSPDSAHAYITGHIGAAGVRSISDIYATADSKLHGTWHGVPATESGDRTRTGATGQGWDTALPHHHNGIVISDGATITALTTLTDAQRDAIQTALDAGDVVVTDPALVTDGTARFAHREGYGDTPNPGERDGSPVGAGEPTIVSRSATAVPVPGAAGWFMTPATAAELGIDPLYRGAIVHTENPIRVLDTIRVRTGTQQSDGVPLRATGELAPNTLTATAAVLIALAAAYGATLLVLLLTAAEARRSTGMPGAGGTSPFLHARYFGALGLITALAGAVPATLIAAIILRGPAVLLPAVGLSLLAWLSGTALGARTARNRGRR